jgi:hypothetical protein
LAINALRAVERLDYVLEQSEDSDKEWIVIYLNLWLSENGFRQCLPLLCVFDAVSSRFPETSDYKRRNVEPSANAKRNDTREGESRKRKKGKT